MKAGSRSDNEQTPIATLVILLGIALLVGLLATLELWMAYGRRVPSLTLARAAVIAVPRWLTIILFVPPILWLGKRVSARELLPWQAIAMHLVLLSAFIVMQTVVYTAAFRSFASWPVPASAVAHFRGNLAWAAPSAMFAYAALVGGAFALHQARLRRAREVQAIALAGELSNARLEALRMQLNPHFLFNALNSLSALITDRDVARAVSTVEQLGELLRYVLQDGVRASVTLEEEVAFATKFLAIEQIRLEERLRIHIEVADNAGSIRVPSLILQPLVENAVRHGCAARSDGGKVSIRAFLRGENLVVQVENEHLSDAGNWKSSSTGLGLSNTRARLREIYEEAASVDLAYTKSGAMAVLMLPIRLPVRVKRMENPLNLSVQ